MCDSLFKVSAAKPHAPIYKNIEFQLWKQESSKNVSTSDSLKSYGTQGFADTTKSYVSSLYRNNASATQVSNQLIKDVRVFTSSNALPPPAPAKLPAPKPKPRPRHFTTYAGSLHGSGNGGQYAQYGNVAQPVEYSSGYYPIYVPVVMYPPVFQAPAKTGESVFTGTIKFFDSEQAYGFFILDCDGSDLFVHYEDFLKAGISKEHIQVAKAINTRFSFQKVDYYGKYNLSSKAINIKIISESY